jgi:hypothetical protein
MHVKHFTKPASVEVTYISTHTNHAVGIQECKYLPLPLSVRKDIQEKFAHGVTLERIMSGKYNAHAHLNTGLYNVILCKILDLIIGSRHQRQAFDQVASRRHFITRQDCRNACRKIRDFANHRHKNDALSVDRIVCELQMENPSPVIAYKVCGRKDEKHLLLKEENFLLVLMTGFQADMFAKFSTLSCIDSTHKTNEYGYKLIMLLVIDEFRKGSILPCKCTCTCMPMNFHL